MKLKRALLAAALAIGLAPCRATAQSDEVHALPSDPTAVIDTTIGRITCELYTTQAPKTVAHFIALAQGTEDWTSPSTGAIMHNHPLYNGTIIHRVIPGYMIQGGDPTGTGTGGPGFRFKDEIDPALTFDHPGRLAMANSGPNSNGSQFFITMAKAEPLNGHHTIFGQCDIVSLFIVRAIASVPRDGSDKPLTPVVLKKITIVHKIRVDRGNGAPSPSLRDLEQPLPPMPR